MHDFVGKWPKLGTAIAARHLEPVLWHGEPCSDVDNHDAPIGDATPAEVSPDGKRLALVATTELDAAAAKSLGVPHDAATLVLIADGPSATLRAFVPMSFPRCVGAAMVWSSDSQRVEASADTGHGVRIALVDVAAGKLVVDAFAGGDAVASPALRHVAWKPWFSGWPDRGTTQYGDVLWVDDRQVWGSDAVGTWVDEIAWTSETTLELCGTKLKGKPAKLRVTIGKSISVKLLGSCTP